MQMFKKSVAVILSLLMLLNVFINPNIAFATSVEYIEAESELPFSDIEKTWKTLSDEELNNYISKNSISNIAGFYYSLSAKDRKVLLARDTMLNEETIYENEKGKKEKMPYYKMILKQCPEFQTYAAGYTSATGYCYYAFYKSSSDYIRYKVDFKITDTSKYDTATGSTYTISATVAQSSGTNMKNLVNASFSKNQTTMQRALTKSAALGSSIKDTNSSGETIYKTKINEVFVLNITFTKPAYTYCNSEFENCISTQRFNFRPYTWQNEEPSSLNRGVYHSNHRETVVSQVNMRNTGIDTSETQEGTAHGLARLVFEHPELTINYNKNSTEASGTSPVVGSRPYDGTQRVLKSVMATCGFYRTGYYIDADEAWKNSGSYWASNSPGYRADEILDFTDGTYFKTKTKTLYANWKEKTGTLSYDANGGSDAPPAETMKYSATAYVSTAVPTMTGYTFTGWNTAADGSGTRYDSGAELKAANVIPADITLYAQWDIKTYTIKYDANGGTGAPADQTKTHDVDLKLSDKEPTKANTIADGFTVTLDANGGSVSPESLTPKDTTSYEFSLWSGSNGSNYNPGDTCSYNGDITLTAQWTPNVTKGSVILPTPTRPGYTFIGWFTEPTGGTKVSSPYTPTEPTTLYAQWSQEPASEAKPPVIQAKDETILEFYEGEEVLKEILLSNIEAHDEVDGNITDRVRITKIEYSEGKIVDGVKTTEKETVSWGYDMPGDYKLDTWFMQLDKEDSPVTHTVTYEVTNDQGITSKLEWPVKVKYNEFPEIKAHDLYFSVDEAQEGKITLEVVMKDARAWDKEDCNVHFPGATHEGHNCLENETACEFTVDKLELLGFDAERFKQFEEAGYEVLTYHVVDQYGKESMRQIVVYIVDDGEIPDVDTAQTVRFINKKQYDKNAGISIDSLTAEEIEACNKNGGLCIGSIWYEDESYVNVITSALAESHKEQEWSFNHSSVGAVKSYLQNNGTDYDQFLDAFRGMKK